MDIVEFTNRTNGTNKRQKAYLVNPYLVVAYADNNKDYQVFNRLSGKPILPVKFSGTDEAIKFAEWITEVFGEWMWAWEVDPTFDVFSMCKWQSMTALRTFVALSLLKDQDTIKLQDIQSAWKVSQQKAKEWTRA